MHNLKNYLNYILEKKQEIDISKDNLDNIYDTQIKRLAYLSYLISKEKDSDNKEKLEKIYNALKDLSFNDGKLRSIGDLIKYIREIQRENNGRVPGIPSDDILQSLDTKMIKFEQYDDDTLKDFIDEEKSKLKDNKDAKKDKDGEKSSDSDEILNDPDTTNDEMEDYIKELKSMEGANKGMCRALCVIDITSGIDVEEPETPEGSEGDEGSDEKEEKEDSIELDDESNTEDDDESNTEDDDDDIPEDPDEDALMGMGIDPDELDELFESLNILLEKNEMSDEDKEFLDRRKKIAKGKAKKGIKDKVVGAGLAGAGSIASSMIPGVGAPIAAVLGATAFVKSVKGNLNLVSAASGAISNEKIKKYAENNKMDLENASIAIASAANDEKDPTKKERLEKQFKMMNYCIYNEKGEKRNVEQQRYFMKKLVGKKGINKITKASKESIGTAIESGELDKLIKKTDKIKPEDLKKFEKAAKKSNDEVQKSIAQYKKEKSNDSEDVKKDEDGNILKQEVVKDPKTGEKKKVITHTGPRGGKFYYPDGKPKTPENRVYVKESLSEYLMRQL